MMEEIIFSPGAALKEPFSIVPVAGATQLKSSGKNKCVLRMGRLSLPYPPTCLLLVFCRLVDSFSLSISTVCLLWFLPGLSLKNSERKANKETTGIQAIWEGRRDVFNGMTNAQDNNKFAVCDLERLLLSLVQTSHNTVAQCTLCFWQRLVSHPFWN